MGCGDIDPVRLKQDIRDILVEDIKVMLSEEVSNMGGGNFQQRSPMAQSEYKENNDISQKMDMVLSQIKSMEQKKSSNDDDVDAFEVQMYEFKESITQLLSAQKNDTKAFEDKINEIMNVRLKELLEQMNTNNANGGSVLDDGALKETISSQMIQLQIALEKQIGNTVSESVEDVIQSKLGQGFQSGGSGINSDALNGALTEIKELISNKYQNAADNNSSSESKENIDFNDKLERTVSNVMNGKIDLFMDEFRKEVVPEVQAVFEQLSLGKTRISSTSYIGDVDDEKAGSNRNELLLENTRLKSEIEQLQEEKSKHDKVLRAAATSKVHQVVRLQNLLDHMRDDNRMLQYQLGKYKEKFAEIREDQENNVVNKFWGYFGNSGPSNHVST